MPTSDQIIESFKTAASKETWASAKNDPGGVALNKAVNDLRDLLNEGDMNACSQKAFTFMESQKGSPSVGVATCKALFEKGPAGKAVATDVAKRVMSLELSRFNPTQGFIREQHAINGLTKQFIQETSPDYEQRLKGNVNDLAKRYNESGMLDRVNSGTDWGTKGQVTSELGKEMVAVLSSTPMSQESVSFLKEMRESIEGNTDYATNWRQQRPEMTDGEILAKQQEIAEIVVNNNSALRFAGPAFATNELAGQNQLWRDAQGASLSTFSAAKKENAPSKVSLDDLPEVAKFKETITKEIHQTRGMVLELQGQIKAGKAGTSLEAQQHLEKQALESALKPRFDKIASLEKRTADLNKTISVEKIKAWFSGKGVNGVKEDLAKEIARTENSIKDSRGQHDTRFKNLKADRVYEESMEQLSQKQGLNPKDIHTALQMPGVNKALMEFAKKEHNSENLEFHQAVDEFNKLAASGASVEQLRTAADDIRKNFVTTGSPKEINISATERADLEQSLDKLGISKPTEQNFESWGPETSKGYGEVFNKTDAAVVKLVQEDTFRRFTADRSFKDAVTKSAEPPVPKVGQTTGIDQRKSLKVEGPSQGVKTSKVGVG